MVIGDFLTIGSSATILPDLRIGKNIYIGSGAIVIKDVKDNSVAVRVAAMQIKTIVPRVDLTIFELH